MKVKYLSLGSSFANHRLVAAALLLAAALAATTAAPAQELTILDGNTTTGGAKPTYNFQVNYTEDLSDRYAYSLTYLNEGHFVDHHRDGLALAFWAKTSVFSPHLILAAGAGPYAYADTFESQHRDIHGMGAIFDLSATWMFDNGLLLQVRADRVAAGNSFNTSSILAGVGYRLHETHSYGAGAGSDEDSQSNPKNSFSLLYGQTVVNIRGDGRSKALILEYRRELTSYADFSLEAIHEGRSELADRFGIAPELWLKKRFFDNRLTMGIGAGVYLGVDRGVHAETNTEVGRFTAGIVSVTASYDLTSHWGVVGTWHRVVSEYDRDSDIWVGGVQYRF